MPEMSMAERLRRLADDEQLIVDALAETYQRGEIDYHEYSAALQTTLARLHAIGCVLGPRDRGSDRNGEDPKGLSGEAIAERRSEESASPKPHHD